MSVIRSSIIVLLIHSGGFVGGDTSDVLGQAEYRAAGVPVKSVPYRLGDPAAGLRDVRKEMHRQRRLGRRVIVVGFSAGGTYALRLAQTGIPEAVAAVAPVADVTHWRDFDPAIMRALTPLARAAIDPMRHGCTRASRTLIVHSRADDRVPYAFSQRYDHRCRHSRLVTVQRKTHYNMGTAHWLRWTLKIALDKRCLPAYSAVSMTNSAAPTKSYNVEVSRFFNGPRTWVTVQAESMTYARAAARRLGYYDTYRVVEA